MQIGRFLAKSSVRALHHFWSMQWKVALNLAVSLLEFVDFSHNDRVLHIDNTRFITIFYAFRIDTQHNGWMDGNLARCVAQPTQQIR